MNIYCDKYTKKEMRDISEQIIKAKDDMKDTELFIITGDDLIFMEYHIERLIRDGFKYGSDNLSESVQRFIYQYISLKRFKQRSEIMNKGVKS